MFRSLAIAVGANLGDPPATLIAARPLLEQAVLAWWDGAGDATGERPIRRWSPLFRTEPVGGPAGQPDYLNAVLILEPAPSSAPGRPPEDPGSVRDSTDPLALLRRLQAIEARFGRERRQPWGPRTLDLDLLWCGDRVLRSPELELPHPRLTQRSFVLAPLAAIDPGLVPPGQPFSCGALLSELLPRLREGPPERLPPRQGWPE